MNRREFLKRTLLGTIAVAVPSAAVTLVKNHIEKRHSIVISTKNQLEGLRLSQELTPKNLPHKYFDYDGDVVTSVHNKKTGEVLDMRYPIVNYLA